MLAFTDLETDGLDPRKHQVFEVACIITTDDLVEVARYHALIQPFSGDTFQPIQFHELDEFIRDMHTKSGLWEEIASTPGLPAASFVDNEFAAFLRKHAVKKLVDDKGRVKIDRPQLAGNTISFDRAFMKVHLPNAEAELHYRNLDCSSLNELARRFNPKLYDARPKVAEVAHRAMADAEESVRTAKYYASAISATILPPTT